MLINEAVTKHDFVAKEAISAQSAVADELVKL